MSGSFLYFFYYRICAAIIFVQELFQTAVNFKNLPLQNHMSVFYAKLFSNIDQSTSHWGSPHATMDLDLIRIRDLDPKTTLPPHNLDPDLSCVPCCVGQLVRSSPALQWPMLTAFVSFRTHARPH